MDYRDRITIDPLVRSGKPCVRGTRISVADVLEDFPDLSAEDIQACLSFAANRERRMIVVP